MAFSPIDWIARTFFISAEDEASAKAVADHQQSLLDRQREEGKLSPIKYYRQSAEVQDTGAAYYDKELGKSGLAGLPGLVPWWVWPLVIGAAVIYFWPALRPFFNRLAK
jgi:alkanesulfonate monooxygenase SsuD/methylene tetrahydromethanopterin reductase-like flavin-dependent oxidoreductase (luciferase family)